MKTDALSSETFRVRVAALTMVTNRVVELRLVPVGRDQVEAWSSGAHILVHLPSGLIRQYSLSGDSREQGEYRIAVLREAAGRGGSIEAHSLRQGDEFDVSLPRNNFPLADAPFHLLIAGGIGITPLAAMAHELQRTGKRFRVVLAVRDSRDAGLVALLPQDCAVEVHISSDGDRVNLSEVLSTVEQGSAVQVCGPARMLDEVASLKSVLDERGAILQVEHFEASSDVLESMHAPGDQPFMVTFARSNETVTVDPDTSILACARRLGKVVESSCEEGYCGTCETGIVSGAPDHRDDFLTADEKAEGETMMICVSRCAGAALVLDL